MKQLSIEEKAKCYDEVKNKLSRFIAQGVDPLITRADVQDFFPELKESEDERIRKEMIEILEKEAHDFPSSVIAEKSNSWIAWLEKQGEHKTVISDDALREGIAHFGITQYQIDNWLKKYVDVEKQGEQKPTWSEEDEYMLNETIQHLEELIRIDIAKHCGCDVQYYQRDIDWLKSLRPQWKPNEEMLEALYRAIPKNVMEISEDEMLLDKLYQGLKYGRVLSEK